MAAVFPISFESYLANPAAFTTFPHPRTGSGTVAAAFRDRQLHRAKLSFHRFQNVANGDTWVYGEREDQSAIGGPPSNAGTQRSHALAAAVMDVSGSADGVDVDFVASTAITTFTFNVFGAPPADFTLAVWSLE